MEMKSYTDAQMEEADRILVEHNARVQATQDPSWAAFRKTTFAIDVTGRHEAYFTFWRIKHPDPNFPAGAWNCMEPMYCGNLSTDLLTSVRKACEDRPNHVIELCRDDNRMSLAGRNRNLDKFTFGKYRGRTYAEVYAENPQYFMWLHRNADSKYAHTPSAQAIAYFADCAMQETTKRNQETSTSRYIGTVGSAKFETLQVTLYDVKRYEGKKTFYCKFKDAAGNRLKGKITHEKLGWLPERINNTFTIKFRVKRHEELMGIQFTGIGNIYPA